MGILSLEERWRRFTALNHRHLTNANDSSHYSKKILKFNTYYYSKNMQVHNGNDEIEAGDHFGNQALFISNGS
jgi:hypothetical protein